MSDFTEQYLDQVSGLFLQLGASSEQAPVMAKQLLKRAEQVAVEQGISKVHAVESLLKKVIEARSEP